MLHVCIPKQKNHHHWVYILYDQVSTKKKATQFQSKKYNHRFALQDYISTKKKITLFLSKKTNQSTTLIIRQNKSSRLRYG